MQSNDSDTYKAAEDSQGPEDDDFVSILVPKALKFNEEKEEKKQ